MVYLILRGFALFLAIEAGHYSVDARADTVVPSYMLNCDSNNMHSCGAATDSHALRGPEQPDAIVRRFVYGRIAGECAGFAFDQRGNIVTVCSKARKTELLLIDPASLDVIDRYSLPARVGTFRAVFAFKFDAIFRDTSGGSYFYLDNLGRAVVTTTDRRLLIIKQIATLSGPRFELDEEYSLLDHVPSDCPRRPDRAAAAPHCDKVTTALPDRSGLIWFVTQKGRVGTVNTSTRRIMSIRLRNERIQNSFAVAEDGVYIVSDHALYRMRASRRGAPQIVWREAYDRGTTSKEGQVGQGSGTTPTLIDSRYVAIADNADSRVNAVVYRRHTAPGQAREVCKVPLFSAGASATDNSFISSGQSLIIENNSGYRHAFHRNFAVGGVVRIDIRADESGCDVVWQSNEISPSAVAKLSRESGLIYLYTVEHRALRDRWSLTAIDFNTGRTVVSIPTGRGIRLDNNWASIALGPTPGMALIGTLTGFVQVQDR